MMTSLVLLVCLSLVTCTVATDVTTSLLFGSSSQDHVTFRLNDDSMSRQSTLCYWVKIISPGGSPMAYSFTVTGGSSYSYVYPGYYTQIMSDNSLDGKLTSFYNEVPRGEWLHSCYSWLWSRNVKVFLNGRHIGTSTSSSGRTRGSGTVMLGNLQWAPRSTYVFGGEMINLNMYSKELTDTEISRLYEGGPCYVDTGTDSYRRLKWEDILTFSRNGNVREIDLSGTCVVLQVRRLNTRLNETRSALEQTKTELTSTKITLNETKTALEETKTELTSTKITLNETKTALEETKTELTSTKDTLNETKTTLEETKTELTSTKTALEEKEGLLTNTTTQLEDANDRLNNTHLHSLYTQCTEDLQNATQQLSIKATHWDVLYQDEYLNRVLTNQTLTSLKSEFDYIDDFIGLNITDKIIQHLKDYHGHDKTETTSTWVVLEDFVGVTLSKKVVRHLEETHVIQTAEDCKDSD